MAVTVGRPPLVDYKEKSGVKYKYPDKLDLRPGTELHEFIKERLIQAAQESRAAMSRRFASWRNIDESLMAYVDLTESEEDIKAKDERKPVSIVIPISYGVLETLLSYFSSTFLNFPYFHLAETEPNDIIKVKLLEHVVNQQAIRAKMGLDMHTQWRDGFVYSMGINVIQWSERWAFRTIKSNIGLFSKVFKDLFQFDSTQERVRVYEGNELFSIDPYNYLPDPSVPVERVQDMQYAGWVERGNYMNFLTQEQNSDGVLFNLKYLEGRSLKTSTYFETKKKPPLSRADYTATTESQPTDRMNFFMKIIPKEWKVGQAEYPEIWFFQLTADSVVTSASRLGADHNMIPISTFVPEFDGHTTGPISKIELTYGMQHAIDWFLNSRIANVRKSLNDMFLVDPYLVNLDDMSNPEPGKLIRLRRAAWGRGIKDVVQQFAVNDVTQTHIQDIMFLMDMMNRTSGASDILQGIMRTSGERRSATEARDAKLGALNRIAKAAKIASLQSHYDTAYIIANNTRQYMEDSTYVKFIGEYAQELESMYGRKGAKVSPTDIDIDFDVIIHDDPSMTEDADSWLTLFQIIGQSQVLSQQIDGYRVFQKIASLLGAKNVSDFRVKTMSQEQIQSQAQQGNLAPAAEVQNNNGQ